jgi:hypothetical protein
MHNTCKKYYYFNGGNIHIKVLLLFDYTTTSTIWIHIVITTNLDCKLKFLYTLFCNVKLFYYWGFKLRKIGSSNKTLVGIFGSEILVLCNYFTTNTSNKFLVGNMQNTKNKNENLPNIKHKFSMKQKWRTHNWTLSTFNKSQVLVISCWNNEIMEINKWQNKEIWEFITFTN